MVLLDHRVVLLCFEKLHTVFTVAASVYVRRSSAQRLPLPLTLPTCVFWFLVCLGVMFAFVLNNNHPDRCEVISHCGFDLHFFPDDW